MAACPDEGQLRAYETGELPDEQADRISKHVATCRACAEAVERFREQNLDSRVIRAAVRASGPDIEVDTVGADADRGAADTRTDQEWDIPDYKRVRLCGEGAFGTVWAVQDRVGVFRALKMIDLDRLRSANARGRESTALEAYCRQVHEHTNLIQVFHVGVRGSLLYYTMELADDAGARQPVRGSLPETYRPLTLTNVLRTGPVQIDTAIEVVLRLLRGLSRLHAVGLAHRDIKPANIVFVNKQPKLADIGMITSTTATPSQVGTPEYMPPDGQMDLTADTFAMGRILYELAVGPAWEKYPALPQRVMESSDTWDLDRITKVLATAGAATAVDRYQHAGRMLEEIESCRLLPYDSLFAELDENRQTNPPRTRSPLTPIAVAAIHVLPWVLGLTLAIVLAAKLL